GSLRRFRVGIGKSQGVIGVTSRQDGQWTLPASLPKNSTNSATSLCSGPKLSPSEPLATTGLDSMSISEPSSRSPPLPLWDSTKEHSNSSSNSKHTNSPNNNPVLNAENSAPHNRIHDHSSLRELRSSKSSVSLTVPTVAGTFSPLRTALGLDEHGYSSSVLEQIVTATARFSSFRDATDAVQMAKIKISESQVRRLAHKVGQELIEQRDAKAIEHRRRQLPARTEVIPEVVAVEVDGGRIRTGAAGSTP